MVSKESDKSKANNNIGQHRSSNSSSTTSSSNSSINRAIEIESSNYLF